MTTLTKPGAFRKSPFLAALLATVFTWPLLFVGGLVTTYRVGMAVPDWPTTFGINMFLYDMSNVAWGVFIEHGHRLYGAAVGFMTILLFLDFLVFSRNRNLILMGLVALLAVIAQGVLGGTRVLQNSTLLAAFHGCFGQLFFAYMVLLCVVTGRGWRSGEGSPEVGARDRFRASFTLLLVYAQIVVGAWVRHFPSLSGLTTHAVLALAVASHVVLIGIRAERDRDCYRALLPASRAMLLTLAMQVVLGVAAWWVLRPFDGIPRTVTSIQALIRTGHQANAALLLGASVVYTAIAFRHSGSAVKNTSTASLPVASQGLRREALT